MRKILDLLLNINFWSIIGALVTVATAAVVIKQHQDVDIIFSLHAKKDLEMDQNEQLSFLFLCVDKIPKTVQKVKIPIPIGFYNDNKRAIDMEVSVKTINLDCSLAPGECLPIKVLRNRGNVIDGYFLYQTAQLRQNDFIDSEVWMLWSYENMSDRSSAKLDIRSFTSIKAWQSYKIEDCNIVVYVPDVEKSTSETFLFKVLDHSTLSKLLE